MDWITDKIALGDCVDAKKVYMDIAGVDATVNCYNGSPIEHDKEYCRVNVNDGYPIADIAIQGAFDFLDKMMGENKKVLVHCMAGISRSPSILAGYISFKMGCSIEDALKCIRQLRPQVDPAPITFKSVKDYVEKLKKIK